MKVLSIIVICFSILAIVAFFMPWIKGAGSIVKPVDDTMKPIQELEPTGLTKGTIKTARGLVDALTETLTPIKLKQTLAGYQIPLSDNKDIKEIGPRVYLLYVLPVAAIICAVFSLMGNRGKVFDLFAFLIAAAVFISLYKEIATLNREGMFVKIRACNGYWFTIYAFLWIGLVSFIKLLWKRKIRPY